MQGNVVNELLGWQFGKTEGGFHRLQNEGKVRLTETLSDKINISNDPTYKCQLHSTCLAQMAQISHKRTRKNKEIHPERLSLLGNPPNTRSTSATGEGESSVVRSGWQKEPPREKSTSARHVNKAKPSQGSESAWWTSPKILGQDDDEQKQDKVITKQAIRQAWLGRLRPRATHQFSPANSSEVRKRTRGGKV
ncbi:hypothetical protein N7452_004193 [Penicillium brevicompactum]|uniref:Uncharacterized protein n=1 Tax=Penicillium brevicompactum TaxID=5074 RepID=A0A9W9QVA9_PENBR|nr:hypothetical protein N7452_004193 [Penicillium brevicompactum]